SVVVGVFTVVLLVATGRAAMPRTPLVGLLAALLIAFDPEFLFVNGAISNDALIALLGAATFLATLHAARAPGCLRRWVVVGGCLGLAMLAKSSAVALVGAIALVMLGLAVRGRRPPWVARAAAAV